MTLLQTLRTAATRRAAYRSIRREIAALPVERAIDDLGLNPYDAEAIARRAVYG